MDITVRRFENKKLDLSVDTYIDKRQIIWFVGKGVSTALGYKDTDQALRKSIDPEDRRSYPVLGTGQVRH